MKLIDKSALVAELEKRIEETKSMQPKFDQFWAGQISAFKGVLKILDTLEVKDPYEQCVQYDSIKAGIQAHAETYSFNIQSELFNQLTKEQQALWRKEIEQAAISGGDAGYLLAKDPRYKENLEVKESLTWEDIRELYIIFAEVDVEIELCKSDNIKSETIGYYQEVLKRFKTQKGE